MLSTKGPSSFALKFYILLLLDNLDVPFLAWRINRVSSHFHGQHEATVNHPGTHTDRHIASLYNLTWMSQREVLQAAHLRDLVRTCDPRASGKPM